MSIKETRGLCLQLKTLLGFLRELYTSIKCTYPGDAGLAN